MKLKLSTDEEGFITNVSARRGNIEVSDAIASQIIVGVSKLVDGVLYYRISTLPDDDGYLVEYGTDPAGETVVPADELRVAIPGATKLVDGHLVVDQTKADELADEAGKPVATDQDLFNAQLMKTAAQLQLTNAALMKQVAEMEVSNG